VSFNADILTSLLSAHPYLLLFPLVVVEGPLATVCAGFLVSLGLMSWPFAYPLAVTADLTGDTFYYLLGRSGRRPRVRHHLARSGLTARRLARLEGAFRKKNLAKTLVGAKIADVAAIPALVAAGLAKVGYGRFLAWDSVATLPKTAVLMALGFIFGAQIDPYLDSGSAALLIMGAGILAVYLAVSKLSSRTSEEEDYEDTDR
jgi:membrane protein DedA with SNARE-associated domain